MKRVYRIGGIVLVVLVVLLIALPFLININSFRPKIESEVGSALGRTVKIGDLSLSIFSGSVEARDISISDDPAFSASPFVTAKQLKVGVELMPLIFSKDLRVTEIKLQQPEITLLHTDNGKWNFSSLGGASPKAPKEPTAQGSSSPALSVAKLNIDNAKLSVNKANSGSKPKVYEKVNIEMTGFSFTSQFPFKLTAQLPGGGNANITGKAGPINSEDAAKTPFDAAVKVNNMDIAASGFIDPATGIKGLANLDGTLNSNGSMAKAIGTFTGNKLVFSPKGTPAPKAVVIKHTVDVDLDKQVATLAQGDIAIGKANAHLTGTVRTQRATQEADLKLNAPEMPVDELEAMAPALGIVIPSGSQLSGGTLSANLTIVGPMDKLVITGPIRLSNTKLAGFNLGSKLGALSAFAGKAVSSPDTSIENASLNARVAPEGTTADNINITVPAIGVISGAGTVSPAGALNFKMVADLHGGAVGGLSTVASAGSGKGGIGFAIEGTSSDPKFIPDVGGRYGGCNTGTSPGCRRTAWAKEKVRSGSISQAASSFEARGSSIWNCENRSIKGSSL
jgi:AsmA protein